MKERPILFSAPMVRAILAGTKTQTRRIVKPQPLYVTHDGVPMLRAVNDPAGDAIELSENYSASDVVDVAIRCPYGVAGDRLWVKENAWIAPPNFCDRDLTTHVDKNGDRRCVTYDADMDEDARRCAKDYGLRMRPSIHMPRWASRLTLEVVAVRVERLSAITEEDAKAEGIAVQQRATAPGSERASCVSCGSRPEQHIGSPRVCPQSYGEVFSTDTYRGGFIHLFRALNKLAPDADPWVWVVEFRRVGAAP